MNPHLQLVACLALVALARGEIFSGSIQTDDHIVYVGKFAMDSGVSTIECVATGDSAVQFVVFDDQQQSWPDVEASNNCTDQLAAQRYWTTGPAFLPVSNFSATVEEGFVRWWYFTFINCNGPVSVSDYTITVLNDGNEQLSQNQKGLPALFCVYFVFLLIFALGFISPMGQKYFHHSMSTFLVVAVILECLSRMFMMSNYFSVKNTGHETNILLGFGLLVDLASQAVLLSHALLVCLGWHIRSMSMVSRFLVLGAIAFYIILAFILIVWGSTVAETWWYVDTLLVTPLGTGLGVYRCLLAVVFVALLWTSTIATEKRTERAAWYKLFFFVSFGWQAMYCFSCFVGHGVSSFDQARIVWGLLCTIDFLYLAALAFLLSPGRVGPLFGSWLDEVPKGSGPQDMSQSLAAEPDL